MTNAACHRVKKLILCTLKYEVPQAHEVHATPHIENILAALHTWKLIEKLNSETNLGGILHMQSTSHYSSS
jgi:hypothetical protein